MPNKQLQSKQAYLSGLSFQRKPINYKLRLPEGNLFGQEIQKSQSLSLENIAKHAAAECAAMVAVIVEHAKEKRKFQPYIIHK